MDDNAELVGQDWSFYHNQKSLLIIRDEEAFSTLLQESIHAFDMQDTLLLYPEQHSHATLENPAGLFSCHLTRKVLLESDLRKCRGPGLFSPRFFECVRHFPAVADVDQRVSESGIRHCAGVVECLFAIRNYYPHRSGFVGDCQSLYSIISLWVQRPTLQKYFGLFAKWGFVCEHVCFCLAGRRVGRRVQKLTMRV